MRLPLLSTLLVCILALFSACNEDTSVSSEVELISFSIPNQNGYMNLLSSEFTISETPEDGKTYYDVKNEVPLPYGAVKDSLVVNYTTIGTSYLTTDVEKVDTTGNYYDETIAIVQNSTLVDLSSVLFVDATAQDGYTTKTYRIWVNYETENPNKITWEKVSDNIPFETNEYTKSYSLNGVQYILSASVDGNTGTISNTLYSTSDGISWNNTALSSDAFPIGVHHAIEVYNNKVYIAGCLSKDAGSKWIEDNTVWTSTDGTTFTQEANIQVPVMANLKSLKGKLVVYGGCSIVNDKMDLEQALYANGAVANPLQSITLYNGTSWETSSKTLPSTMPTILNSNTLLNGKIFAVSGMVDDSISTDVWASEDGEYWVKVADNSLLPYEQTSVITYKNSLFMVGGELANWTISPLRYSKDEGQTWYTAYEDAGSDFMLPETFTKRAGHVTWVDEHENIWILGGFNKQGEGTKVQLSDVWKGSVK